jgi:hypothetical protein
LQDRLGTSIGGKVEGEGVVSYAGGASGPIREVENVIAHGKVSSDTNANAEAEAEAATKW